MKVHCKNTDCLHNTSTITGAFGECKRGYIILDVMGMCDVFVKKAGDENEPAVANDTKNRRI